jgi:sRNA-binding protein
MARERTFVVYRREGGRLVSYKAALRRRYAAWSSGRPVGLPRVWVQLLEEIPWGELYAGHTAWVGEQISRVKDAIQRERARRAERRAATAPAATTTPAAQ